MKLPRVRFIPILFASLFFIFPAGFEAHRPEFPLKSQDSFVANNRLMNFDFENSSDFRLKSRIVKTPTEGGIKEDIPKKYSEKYQRWKTQLLSTDFGREQWEFYESNKRFVLTVTISDEKEQGAKTDDYLWDEAGNFVGATITLGSKSDKGFPDPIYYPVMNSLASLGSNYAVEGDVLAATKLAHEIGHVNQAFEVSKDTFQLQNELMPVYISIFLKNGHNSRDQNLIKLAEQMGGTPVKIWENREYWSEVNAMHFLNEKFSNEFFYCSVFSKIKRNVETYAKNYEDRFDQVQISACGK